MSRLAFRSPETSPVTVNTQAPTTTHHIIIEATVRPVGAKSFNKLRVEKQATDLKRLRIDGKDVFELNETRKVQSAGTILYQTQETYGTSMSIENIAEKLAESDLTLRVNFNRPGVHSNTTCMQLSADTLTKLVRTSENADGLKIAELRVKADSESEVPVHGAMYVAITKRGTQHYLSHVDYKIMASYDAMYHED